MEKRNGKERNVDGIVYAELDMDSDPCHDRVQKKTDSVEYADIRHA